MEEITEIKPTGPEKIYEYGIKTEDMAEAGVQYSHKPAKCHPKMKPFVAGLKNGIQTINLEKSAEMLVQTIKFIEGSVAAGEKFLLVGTKPQIRDLVKKTAEETGIFYVADRWLGGTFTNFGTLKKRIDDFKALEQKRESGELSQYTKKERANFDRQIGDMERKYAGIKNMEKLPEVMIALDLNFEKIAVAEALKKGVKIVGIADTNSDPSLADYFVPANDDSISSMAYILNEVKKAIQTPSVKPE